MRNLAVFVLVIAGVFLYVRLMDPPFEPPVSAEKTRKGGGIRKYEFDDLFARNKAFSQLAVGGYYTVVEGYMDSCRICKKLEAGFPAFLAKRGDVIVRRVRFPEERSSHAFNASNQADLERQMRRHFERMGRYRFFRVVDTGSGFEIGTCGTPHIEIYGPDERLIVGDACTEEIGKDGLQYLRRWIAAEEDA